MFQKRLYLQLRDVEVLFRPLIHRKILLKNRIVMAPMSRGLAPEGVPIPEMAAYYRSRAQHGVGFIVSEACAVPEASSSADSCMPAFFGGAALRAWKHICREVHAFGCAMAPQLTHVGMLRAAGDDVPNPSAPPIGPSGIDVFSLQAAGETMSRTKIDEVKTAFALAAASARSLGFDAVEIQGGHGGLIDQFLWGETNKRTDVYGGDVVGRTRFACEVVHAVRKAVGRRFAIIFRLSQGKPGHAEAKLATSPHELSLLLQPLVQAGVDVFDCSTTQHFAAAEFAGSPLPFAAWVRLLSGRPVISVGTSGRPPLRLLQMLSAGDVDMVAIGRALVADAAWAEKVRTGRESELLPYSLKLAARLY